MKTWLKFLIVTLVVGIPALPLGMMIWPPAGGEGTGAIPVYVIVGLMGIAVAEALALGLGVAFLLFGLPLVRSVAGPSRTRAWAMFLSIGWMLVSWWPHSGAHRSSGSIEGLLAIEYTYHLTLIIAGAVLAYSFLSILRERAGTAAVPAPRTSTLETAPGAQG